MKTKMYLLIAYYNCKFLRLAFYCDDSTELHKLRQVGRNEQKLKELHKTVTSETIKNKK